MQEVIVDDKKLKSYKQKSLFAFSVFFIMIIIAIISWRWLINQPVKADVLSVNKEGFNAKESNGIQQPIRNVLSVNEKIFSSIFNKQKLVKEYPKNMAVKTPRVNGDVGLDEDFFDAATWKLQVVKTTGDTLFVSLDDIKKLPKIDVVYNFKCIEGWSQITWWSGVRFSDFLQHYNLTNEAQLKYVGMKTPDEEYYVGIDMPSAIQAQTILCYEMNGKPLPMNQGYPLRLIIPVKYGVKHIKRIGTISFANNKPADYWAERGYDYYTGH